jgi:hypothetical protein
LKANVRQAADDEIGENGDAGYLGDPWQEAGAMAGFEPAIEQGPGLFLGALGVIIGACAALAFGLWYLAAPRLAQITPAVPAYALAAVGTACTYAFCEYLGLVLTVYTGRNFLLPLSRVRLIIIRMIPLARRLARLLGSTADRMTHSTVRVSNAVMRAGGRKRQSGRPLLVLLPRCIQKPECPQPLVDDVDNCRRCGACPVASLLDLRNEYDDVIMAVLTGGSVVAGVIRKIDPGAVIGVACERELITGIMTVPDRPVVGVPNQRPEGPCRATVLKLDDLRAAIEIFESNRGRS